MSSLILRSVVVAVYFWLSCIIVYCWLLLLLAVVVFLLVVFGTMWLLVLHWVPQWIIEQWGFHVFCAIALSRSMCMPSSFWSKWPVAHTFRIGSSLFVVCCLFRCLRCLFQPWTVRVNSWFSLFYFLKREIPFMHFLWHFLLFRHALVSALYRIIITLIKTKYSM